MNYTKLAKTFEEQVSLLKSRGLKIEDDATVKHFLSNVSYYRLSAYLLSFQVYGDPNHNYMPWASFARVMRLYAFDRELRLILLDAIERIEVAFRCRVIYEYSHDHGSIWYQDNNLFMRKHTEFMTIVKREINSSKESFIQHYLKKYSNPSLPPAWMTLEILSFGTLSTMYKNLKLNNTKKKVANYFGVNPTVFESWIEHLVYIRNLCAHHCRVWNRTMTVSATIPTHPTFTWILHPPSKPNKIYTTISVVAYLLNRVNTNAPINGRIRILLERYPEIDTNAAGFNSNWRKDPFWRTISVSITHVILINYFWVRKKMKNHRKIS